MFLLNTIVVLCINASIKLNLNKGIIMDFRIGSATTEPVLETVPTSPEPSWVEKKYMEFVTNCLHDNVISATLDSTPVMGISCSCPKCGVT